MKEHALRVKSPTGTVVYLEKDTLRSGTRIVRPFGACGTCGFWPSVWACAIQRKHETPRRAFLRTKFGAPPADRDEILAAARPWRKQLKKLLEEEEAATRKV